MRKVIRWLIDKTIGLELARSVKAKLFPESILDELCIISQYYSKKKNHGTMIDVGVQYGQSSHLFLKLDWDVYGFEPDKENSRNIPVAIRDNTRFSLYDIAISDKPGLSTIYTSQESSGISSLLNFHQSHVASDSVQTDTLQNQIDTNGISNIKVIKIDTEGYDLNVLKGIDFSKCQEVEVIICEYEDQKTEKLGYFTSDIIEHLTAAGFGVLVCVWEPIIRYGVKHTFREVKKWPCKLDASSWGNIIAYKDFEFEKFFLKRLNHAKKMEVKNSYIKAKS
jgi:FkbM family methyltransferase